ncbi:MAG: hypothetical protein ABIW49_08610 [Knoellia sp.]
MAGPQAWRRGPQECDDTQHGPCVLDRETLGFGWHLDDLRPGADDFSVSVWLTPTDAEAFPRGTKSAGSVSPNVVQKGLANTAGGFWKVGLQMVRTAQGLAWAPECVLRGRDGVTVVANRSVRASSVGGAGAIVISNNAAVSVAHKPGTKSARDVYDGLLADLVMTRG